MDNLVDYGSDESDGKFDNSPPKKVHHERGVVRGVGQPSAGAPDAAQLAAEWESFEKLLGDSAFSSNGQDAETVAPALAPSEKAGLNIADIPLPIPATPGGGASSDPAPAQPEGMPPWGGTMAGEAFASAGPKPASESESSSDSDGSDQEAMCSPPTVTRRKYSESSTAKSESDVESESDTESDSSDSSSSSSSDSSSSSESSNNDRPRKKKRRKERGKMKRKKKSRRDSSASSGSDSTDSHHHRSPSPVKTAPSPEAVPQSPPTVEKEEHLVVPEEKLSESDGEKSPPAAIQPGSGAKPKISSQSRSRSGSHRSRSRSKPRSKTKRSRSRSKSRRSSSASKSKRSRSRSKSRKNSTRSTRSRSRSRSSKRPMSKGRRTSTRPSSRSPKKKSRDRSVERKRSRSHRSRSHGRDHKHSKRRSRSRSHDRKGKHVRSRGGGRRRSRSHGQRRSRSRDRRNHRSRSRERRGHRRPRKQSRSRSKERDGRRGKRRSRSGSRKPEKVTKKNQPRSFKEHLKQQLMEAQKNALEGKGELVVLDKKDANQRPNEKPNLMLLGADHPLLTMAGGIPMTGDKVTPQQALLQTMAAMHQKAQEITGVAVPKYYNPAAVNPLKYAEQVQKRKLLWHKNRDAQKDVQQNKEWSDTSFAQDAEGKVAAKFRKLMGIKEGEGGEEGPSSAMLVAAELTSATPSGTGAPLGGESAAATAADQQLDDKKKKQEELFRQLDKEYEFARMATHTHRGIGLGFASLGLPD